MLILFCIVTVFPFIVACDDSFQNDSDSGEVSVDSGINSSNSVSLVTTFNYTTTDKTAFGNNVKAASLSNSKSVLSNISNDNDSIEKAVSSASFDGTGEVFDEYISRRHSAFDFFYFTGSPQP